MNRNEFRQYMNEYKQARESNPSLSYWEWKANKYADGTDEITNITLPEVVVTPSPFQHYYFSTMRPNMDKNTGVELAKTFDILRGIGDIEYNNNYAEDDESYFAILTDLYKEAGSPEVYSNSEKGVRIFFPDGSPRPYIMMPLFGKNEIHNAVSKPFDNNIENSNEIYYNSTSTINNILAELAHPIQKKYGKNKRYKNVIKDNLSFKKYNADNKDSQGRTWYQRPDGMEWETHYVFEPILRDAFFESTYDEFKNNNVFSKQNIDNYRILAEYDLDNETANKFEKGTDGIVDELKATSRTTLTPEEQQYLLNKSKQRQKMSGAITPVFDIQDAVDFTPIGDVLTARDAYNAVQDRDYIKASAMLGLMLAPPALGKIAKEKIPSFVTAAADKINELRRRERRQKELDTKIFSQGIEDRNRIIEELYDTSGIWYRAYNADITYGTNYVDTYSDLINNYYSNYFNLPEPIRKDIGNASAMMSAKPEAITRYNDEGIPASWNDFAYYINPSIENLDKALTRHEIGHYVDFNMSKSNNADKGNLMFDELRKDLSVDPNPLIPNQTDYFRKGTEQKSYMNTLRQFMFDNNMINRIDDQVTQKQIKEAINKLPSELKSVKAAYQQFKSPRKYTKWFNTIPLLGTIPFIYNYSQEKDSN